MPEFREGLCHFFALDLEFAGELELIGRPVPVPVPDPGKKYCAQTRFFAAGGSPTMPPSFTDTEGPRCRPKPSRSFFFARLKIFCSLPSLRGAAGQRRLVLVTLGVFVRRAKSGGAEGEAPRERERKVSWDSVFAGKKKKKSPA